MMSQKLGFLFHGHGRVGRGAGAVELLNHGDQPDLAMSSTSVRPSLHVHHRLDGGDEPPTALAAGSAS